MNIRITPGKLFVITAFTIASLLVIFMIGASFVSAGVIKNFQASIANFLPVLLNGEAIEPVVTGDVLIVFSSTDTTVGDAGGRTGLANICYTQDPSSHLCSLSEIETAWANRGVIFQSPFMASWIDSFSVADRSWTSRSCDGWTSTTSDDGGTFVSDNASILHYDGPFAPCADIHHVACCKTAP